MRSLLGQLPQNLPETPAIHVRTCCPLIYNFGTSAGGQEPSTTTTTTVAPEATTTTIDLHDPNQENAQAREAEARRLELVSEQLSLTRHLPVLTPYRHLSYSLLFAVSLYYACV